MHIYHTAVPTKYLFISKFMMFFLNPHLSIRFNFHKKHFNQVLSLLRMRITNPTANPERGMGNGEWGTGNGEWGTGNGEIWNWWDWIGLVGLVVVMRIKYIN